MANKLENGQAKLTNRIIEMIEGESPEVLEEFIQLLTYHTGYAAGVFSGDDTFEQIINSKPNELIL